MKGLFQLSSAILFALIADQIFWKADQLVIGKVLNTSAVAVYSVGSQIYMNYTPLGTAISSVFMSKLSKLYDVEKDIQSISELFIKVGRIAFLFLGLILCGFILFGQEFILLWAGEGYKEAYYVAVIIMIPLTVDAMQNLGLTILQVMNKYGFRGKVYFIIAIINIITTVFLVKTVGIVGAAISTAISMAIGNGVIMNLYYNKLGLNIRKFWKEIIKLLPVVMYDSNATAGFRYPVNAMGTSKAMMEKVIVAKSRTVDPEKTKICCTRYGNVMCSRGSVIPLWIEQIKAGNPITITEPSMTRFIMSLEEAVDLVLFAFENGTSGDILVQKAPACTIEVLAKAVTELFAPGHEIKVIGIRHGEKMYETLLTNEECANAIDMGEFYRVPCDKRDLNYDKYFKEGDVERNTLTEFNSSNTELLDVEQVKEKLLTLQYIRDELAEWENR